MPSYLKDYTKAQATRPIVVSQEGFISGMNLDSPSRSLESTSVAYCTNFIPKRSKLDPRSGTELIGSAPEGVVNYYGIIAHPKGSIIGHWDNKLYVSVDFNTWTETTGVWAPSDSESNMKLYGDDILVFQEDRILVIELENSNYVRKFNADNPKYAPDISSNDDSGDFIYRYTYTYARYVGEDLVAESGTYRNKDYTAYFTEVTTSNPLGGGSSVSINEFPSPADSEDGLGTQWTHINFYRTRDIGINNESQRDYYYLCLSYSIEGSLYGIGDMQIQGSPIFTISKGTGSLSINDDDLQSGKLLNKLFYVPIPNGLIASVSSGLVSIQDGENSKVNYTFTGVSERAGYYFEGTQFNEIEGKITELSNIDGYTAIICTDRTYLQTDSAYSKVSETLGADIGMTIEAIDKPFLVNANVGVLDRGTIAFDVPGQFLALCNDGSVRSFSSNGGWGSTDYSREKVSKELRAVASGSSSFFHPEGYYVLTYSKDTGSLVCDNTLRLGLAEDVGNGWSFYSGDGWMKPLRKQSYLKMTYNGYFSIFCINGDGLIFRIETYDGPVGSGLVRQTKDRVGDSVEYEIPCIVEFPEAGPSSMSYWVKHLQTTVNIVPSERNSIISSSNKVTAKLYENDNLMAFASYSNVKSLKNIVVNKDVTTDYIRLRLEFTEADASILGYEMILMVMDMPKKDETNDEAYQTQNSFNNGLVFDVGRVNNEMNLTKTLKSGAKYSVDSDVVETILGADGKTTSGMRFQ